jgi:acetylglutamate kinase
VFGDADTTRALIEQIAILHYLGVAWCWCTAAARSSRRSPRQARRAHAHGAGPARDGPRLIDATSMVLNGLINTRILAICRELDMDAVGVSGVDAGLIRAHKRAPSS